VRRFEAKAAVHRPGVEPKDLEPFATHIITAPDEASDQEIAEVLAEVANGLPDDEISAGRVTAWVTWSDQLAEDDQRPDGGATFDVTWENGGPVQRKLETWADWVELVAAKKVEADRRRKEADLNRNLNRGA
jgi:hypothetical protein